MKDSFALEAMINESARQLTVMEVDAVSGGYGSTTPDSPIQLPPPPSPTKPIVED